MIHPLGCFCTPFAWVLSYTFRVYFYTFRWGVFVTPLGYRVYLHPRVCNVIHLFGCTITPFTFTVYARRRTTPYVVKRMQHFCTYDVVQYVPAHTQPRAQLVDVKCVVPPAPEHSQTALLTSESIGGSCHCPAEVIVRVWHIYPSHRDDAARREPRSIEEEFVDFDDDKICQNV